MSQCGRRSHSGLLQIRSRCVTRWMQKVATSEGWLRKFSPDPDFVVESTKTQMELVAVSAAELGFKTDTVTLAAVYARARQLGFGLAAAEVGPQLRLQYFDQPVGEFLIVGMEPIMTWNGEAVILNVANGGAGLVLIGQDGRAEAEISATSRILFVSSKQAVPADARATAAIISSQPSSKNKPPDVPER